VGKRTKPAGAQGSGGGQRVSKSSSKTSFTSQEREMAEQVAQREREKAEKVRSESTKNLSKTARSRHEPSIKVLLVPSEELSDRFESWLVLHLPDGKVPFETKLGKDSYSRDEAVTHLIEVFTAIGEKHAVGEAPDPIETARLSSALVTWKTSNGKRK
jgi:hypothetical protein